MRSSLPYIRVMVSTLRLPRPLVDDDAAAVGLLRRYYADTNPGFSGRHFERLGGGGDASTVRDRFTADDLVAVTMLSVQVPPHTAWALLEERSASFGELLEQIPTDVDLVDVDADTIAPSWPAWQLWESLRAMDGIGWVTAGKLLARKRPRLIPVYDEVVRGAVQPTGSFWQALHLALNTDGLHGHLLELRDESGIGDDISPLRVFDVVTWMDGRSTPR